MLSASQDGCDARQKLADIERLRDVVIRAELQSESGIARRRRKCVNEERTFVEYHKVARRHTDAKFFPDINSIRHRRAEESRAQIIFHWWTAVEAGHRSQGRINNMNIEYIQTPDAPAPAGHYSQAIVYNGIVYVSGQLSIDPRTGERLLGSIDSQTRQVLTNIEAILKASNSDLSRVLKMTVYVADIESWGAVNIVYTEFMGNHRPARAVVPTSSLHYGFQIEIEAVAAVNT